MSNLSTFVGKNVDKIQKRVMKRIQDRAQKALDFWYDYIDWKMSEPKSGRKYTKTIEGTTYTWIASLPGDYPGPGEFPYNLTGRTIDSIHKFVSVGPKQVRLYLKIGDGLKYVPWLEETRPLLAASRKDCREEIMRILLD